MRVMVRTVVRTLTEDGRDALGPGTMIWRDHNVDIQNRSILIVESNEKAIVRTQGQITDIYGPGSTNLNSPNSGVYSAFKRLNYGGNVPWLCEALFFSMARFEAKSAGVSQSSELIPIQFQVAYYFQVDDPKLLLQAVQLSGDRYTVDHLAIYMSPIIDQAVSTVVNKVKVEEIYEKQKEIADAVTSTLQMHLAEIGVKLIMSRVIRIEPEDPFLRRIIQIREFDGSEEGKPISDTDAIRVALSELMARNGDPAATNMMLGVPYYQFIFGAGLPPGLVGNPGGKEGMKPAAVTSTEARQNE
jgi:hypothetical protein